MSNLIHYPKVVVSDKERVYFSYQNYIWLLKYIIALDCLGSESLYRQNDAEQAFFPHLKSFLHKIPFYSGCGVMLGKSGIDMHYYATTRCLRFNENNYVKPKSAKSGIVYLDEQYHARVFGDPDSYLFPFVIIPTQRALSWVEPLYTIAKNNLLELTHAPHVPIFNEGIIYLDGNTYIDIKWIQDPNGFYDFSYHEKIRPFRLFETQALGSLNKFRVDVHFNNRDGASLTEFIDSSNQVVNGNLDSDYDRPEPATGSPEKRYNPKTMITRPEIVSLLGNDGHTWNWLSPTLDSMHIKPSFIPKRRNEPNAYWRSEIEKAITAKRETD